MKRLKWILLSVLLVVVIVVAAVGIYVYIQLNKDVPELAKIDRELAFISDQNGNWDIYILQEDGTLRNVTEENDADDYLFYFTFNRDMIYFYSNSSGAFNPARIKLDGSEREDLNFMTAAVRAFGSGHMDMDPNWSPGADRLAWSKTATATSDICIAAVDDVNNFDCLTAGQGANVMPAWSPDGLRMAFASDRNGGRQDIFIADVPGGNQTQLTPDDPSGYAFQPVWSMDGQQIMYVWNGEDDALVNGDLDLWVVGVDGSNLHRLGEGEVFTGDPSYSPSGNFKAYMTNENGTWRIYVSDADGSNPRLVSDEASNSLFPAWVPSPASENE
jgi:TolB protein